MNEQALNDSFLIFKEAGYKGSLEDYKLLMSTNKQALNDSYTLFANAGYSKKIDDFSTLIGVGKQSDPLYGVTDGSQWLDPPAPDSEVDSPSTQPNFWEKGIEASLLIENNQWSKIIGDDPENSGVPDLIWRGMEDESSHFEQIAAREKSKNPNVLSFPMPVVGSIEDENHPNNVAEFQALETPAERYRFLVDYEDGAYLSGANFTSETLPSQIARGNFYFNMKKMMDLRGALAEKEDEVVNAKTTDANWWANHFEETGRKKSDYKKVTSPNIGSNYYFINSKGETEWVDDSTFQQLDNEAIKAERLKNERSAERTQDNEEKNDLWNGVVYGDDGDGEGHVTGEDMTTWMANENENYDANEVLESISRNLNRKYVNTNIRFETFEEGHRHLGSFDPIHGIMAVNQNNGKREKIPLGGSGGWFGLFSDGVEFTTSEEFNPEGDIMVDGKVWNPEQSFADRIAKFVDESDYRQPTEEELESGEYAPDMYDYQAADDFEANKKVAELTGGEINKFGENSKKVSDNTIEIIPLGEGAHESISRYSTDEVIGMFLGPTMNGQITEGFIPSAGQFLWEGWEQAKLGVSVNMMGNEPTELQQQLGRGINPGVDDEYDLRHNIDEAGFDANKKTVKGEELLAITRNIRSIMSNELARMVQPGSAFEVNQEDLNAIYESTYQTLNRQGDFIMSRSDFSTLTGGANGGMLSSIVSSQESAFNAANRPSLFSEVDQPIIDRENRYLAQYKNKLAPALQKKMGFS